MEDDASLVQRTVGGDPAAFGDLYDRYAGMIRAVCFDTTHDLNAAQDLAQEVFLRAYSTLPKLRAVDRFGPWLFAIARHVCQEWRRKKKRDRHQFTADPPEVDEAADQMTSDSLSDLRLAMTQLPERERLALHLLYLQEHPANFARSVMGLSSSAFYKVVARARERLAKLLSSNQEIIP
jgi:RNA polymerase sigma-70 factor (ECF subfamily)